MSWMDDYIGSVYSDRIIKLHVFDINRFIHAFIRSLYHARCWYCSEVHG